MTPLCLHVEEIVDPHNLLYSHIYFWIGETTLEIEWCHMPKLNIYIPWKLAALLTTQEPHPGAHGRLTGECSLQHCSHEQEPGNNTYMYQQEPNGWTTVIKHDTFPIKLKNN